MAFLLGIIGSFGTIIVGALLVADGKLNFGIVMAVVTLQMSMSSAMQRLGSSLAAFSTSVVRAGHVFDFLELEQEECVGWNTQTQVDTVDLHDKCNVAIELYKLHFSYLQLTVQLHRTASLTERIISTLITHRIIRFHSFIFQSAVTVMLMLHYQMEQKRQ